MSDNDTIATTAPPAAEAKKHLSRGDKLFDTLVYTGLNNISTFLLSLGITFGALHGFKKVGVGNEAVNEQFKALTKDLGKFLNKIRPNLGKNADDIMLTTALGFGGTLMIVPIKLLEDRRNRIVDYFNKKLGDKTDPSQLKEPPKQSWGSLLLGRAAAWTVVFASITGAKKLLPEGTFEKFSEGFAEHVVAKPLGKSVKAVGPETAEFRLGKIAAVDVFATIAATLILETSSKFFANRREAKQEAKALAQSGNSDVRADTASDAAIPAVNTPNASPRTQISEATLEKGPVREASAQPQLA